MNKTFQLAVLYIGIVLFLFIHPFFLSAQEVIDSAQYRAVYNFSYKTKPDQTEYAKTDLMYLDIGQKATKFYSRYEQIRDSVMFDGLDRKLSIYEVNDNRRQYTKGSRKIYYHLFDEKRIIVSDMFTARNYVYEETLQMPRWGIETETKEILGYLCQKATTECAGRKWIVFFSPQIPINKGPFKLWGLPGLVVEAQDSNSFFNFSLSSFEKLSEQIDIIYTHRTYSDKKYDKLSRKDFLKYETFSHKDPLGFMDTALGIKLTSFNDGGKEKMAALKIKGGIPLISLEIE